MKLKSLLIINAIVLGVSGAGALLFPAFVLTMYGVESGPAALLMAQYSGLGSVAIALITWFFRGIEDQNARRALILALMITYVVGAILSVLGTISGIMKIGWPVVGIYLIFASGYAYFQFFKKKLQ